MAPNAARVYYKTAELIRDDIGCYYFACLQCGKFLENLEDIIDHIENYFNEDSEKSVLPSNVCGESERVVDDTEESAVQSEDFNLPKIKDEPLDEYEDYKLTSQPICEVKSPTLSNYVTHCPLCNESISSTGRSLRMHLMIHHHRDRRYAEIYKCNVCGKNTFTRPYDLRRHELIHIRNGHCSSNFGDDNNYADSDSTNNVQSTYKPQDDINGDQSDDSFATPEKVIPANEFLITDIRQITPTTDTTFNNSCDTSSNPKSSTDHIQQHQNYDDDNDFNPKSKKEVSTLDYNSVEAEPCQSIKPEPTNCPICRKSFKFKTLESHLMTVHNRTKVNAKIFECQFCRKNTFTRSYDLKRHELLHTRKAERKLESLKATSKQNITEDDKTKNSTPNNLQSAERKSINEPLPRNFIPTDPTQTEISCVICNAQFKSYSEVTSHLRTIHNCTKMYKCGHSNCEKDYFLSSFDLHRHEMSHYHHFAIEAKRRMNCVFCKRSFNKKWNLMQHEKRHLIKIYKNSTTTV